MSSWKCLTCETLNSDSSESCEVCDKPRPDRFLPRLPDYTHEELPRHSVPRSPTVETRKPTNKQILWVLGAAIAVMALLLVIRPTPQTAPVSKSQQIKPTPVNIATSPPNLGATNIASSAVAQAAARVYTTQTAVAVQTAVPRQTATAESLPSTGRVTSNGLRVRPGPGTEYDPPVTSLRQGTAVSIIGWSTASDGTRWWKIASPAGWVSSDFVSARGCIDCVPRLDRPAIPTSAPAPPTSTPVPSTPTPVSLATNGGPLLNQGQNGWSYQYEQGRGSGNFALLSDRRTYNGVDCYIFPAEGDARLCANGELHPGTTGRVAYRWDSGYEGKIKLSVTAHKIDTSCGDGVWVGVYVGERGQGPLEQGSFTITGGENTGRPHNFDLEISPSMYVLVMVDIGRNNNSGCDQSRVFVDINRR